MSYNPFRNNQQRKSRVPYKAQWEIEEEKQKQKLEEEQQALANTLENFPTLGNNGSPKTLAWGGGKKFVELASEWKEDEEHNEILKRMEASEESERHRLDFALPKFHNVRRFIEPEDFQEEQDISSLNIPQKDEWIEVKKKVHFKKEKTLEEKFPDPEDEHSKDSVWADGVEEHETCWEDKKY